MKKIYLAVLSLTLIGALVAAYRLALSGEEVIPAPSPIPASATATPALPKPVVAPRPVVAPKPGAAVFTAPLEEVNTGCFADGECYVVVGGRHVTVLVGRRAGPVGSLIGVASIGDLEPLVGRMFEVVAHPNSDGTYTLYGDADYHLALVASHR